MKKTLLILGLFGFAIGLQAQQANLALFPNKQTVKFHPKFDYSKFRANKGNNNANRAAGDAFWLNYGTSIDALNNGGTPGLSELNSNYLFQDSLCFGEFGAGNFSSIWVHHIGDVLDVKSTVFQNIDGVNWTAATAYYVDSMSINYGYTRNDPDPSVVDTLIVTLMSNAAAANMPGFYFTGATAANYGTDTLSFRALKYNQTTNKINASGVKIIKIPLTVDDTAITFFREKQFQIPSHFNVAAGKLLGADIQFKPGYTYALGDHIDTDHNAFFFTSFEENGASTLPTFFDCNLLTVSCDYNCSHLVPQDVRYNTAGSWNGYFIPSYAYTAPFAFEHHLISYKVVDQLSVGLSEEDVINGFNLGQNYPNPFKDQTTISYHLNKSASKISLQLYDVQGVKLIEKNQSNLKSGSYSFDINKVSLATGVYFYVLNVDGNSVTKKMIVLE